MSSAFCVSPKGATQATISNSSFLLYKIVTAIQQNELQLVLSLQGGSTIQRLGITTKYIKKWPKYAVGPTYSSTVQQNTVHHAFMNGRLYSFVHFMNRWYLKHTLSKKFTH